MITRLDGQLLVYWYKYRWELDFAEYPYIYRWKKYLPEFFGRQCRLLVTGAANSILVEFDNGVQLVTSRYAILKKKPK